MRKSLTHIIKELCLNFKFNLGDEVKQSDLYFISNVNTELVRYSFDKSNNINMPIEPKKNFVNMCPRTHLDTKFFFCNLILHFL